MQLNLDFNQKLNLNESNVPWPFQSILSLRPPNLRITSGALKFLRLRPDFFHHDNLCYYLSNPSVLIDIEK